jgi:hypothetical protein
MSLLLLSGAEPALAEENAISVCGRVSAFTAATSTTDGSVALGTRTYVLRADDLYSRMGQNTQTLGLGRELCVQGSATGNAFTQYVAINIPSPYCGAVIRYEPATGTRAGSLSLRDVGVADFPIPAGSSIGEVRAGARVCVVLRIDPSGDAVVSSRWDTLAERTVARVNWCGRVVAWTAPMPRQGSSPIHETAGSITVGSRTFAISAGTVYGLINRLPVVGQPTCLGGSLDSGGALIEYGAQPWLPSCVGGQIDRYIAPTATTAGEVKFAVPQTPLTEYSYRYPIPAGTTMPPDAASGAYCFTLALDAGGDAIVTGARIPEPGGVAGEANSPGPSTLPSTSTSGERRGS